MSGFEVTAFPNHFTFDIYSYQWKKIDLTLFALNQSKKNDPIGRYIKTQRIDMNPPQSSRQMNY